MIYQHILQYISDPGDSVLKYEGGLDDTELTTDVERQLPDDSAQQTGCLFILISNLKTAKYKILFFTPVLLYRIVGGFWLTKVLPTATYCLPSNRKSKSILSLVSHKY